MRLAVRWSIHQRQKVFLKNETFYQECWFVNCESPELAAVAQFCHHGIFLVRRSRASAHAFPYFFVPNPCVGRRFVDASDSQAPDALICQLLAESSSAS